MYNDKVKSVNCRGWNLRRDAGSIFMSSTTFKMTDFDFDTAYGTEEYQSQLAYALSVLHEECYVSSNTLYWVYATPNGMHVFHMHDKEFDSNLPLEGADSKYENHAKTNGFHSVRISIKEGEQLLPRTNRFIVAVGAGRLNEARRTAVLRVNRFIQAAGSVKPCRKGHNASASVLDKGRIRCGICHSASSVVRKLAKKVSSAHELMFGVEIEVSDLKASILPSGWAVCSDSSLRGPNSKEVVSPPLSLNKLYMVEVVADLLRMSSCNETCGLHVHQDVSDLSVSDLRRLVESYKIMETWLAANYAPHRTAVYCQPIGQTKPVTESDSVTQVLTKTNGGVRYYGLNLQSIAEHGTVEFRSHKGTVDADQITNWIKLTHALVRSSKKGVITDFVEFLKAEGLWAFYSIGHGEIKANTCKFCRQSLCVCSDDPFADSDCDLRLPIGEPRPSESCPIEDTPIDYMDSDFAPQLPPRTWPSEGRRVRW